MVSRLDAFPACCMQRVEEPLIGPWARPGSPTGATEITPTLSSPALPWS